MKRLLYLTHRVPFPPDKGDRIRTYHTLQSLAEHYQVDLLALADEPVSHSTRTELERLSNQLSLIPLQSTFRQLRMACSILSGGSASLTAFHSKEMIQTIHQWMQDRHYDGLLASSSSMMPYLEPYIDKKPVIVDLVDVDSEKWFNYASSAPWYKKWIYHREGQALRRYESQLAAQSYAMLFVSEAERDLFRTFNTEGNLVTVTNGVDLEYFSSKQALPLNKRCVFVGALDYHPNVDAVVWFADEVWPLVLQQHPEAVFSIVGRKPVASVQSLSTRPGIEVVGQVPDVRPYVEASRVAVAPLRIARGLQNKVLEALAMSRPVLASGPALAGLSTSHPCPARRAETPEQWTAALHELFTNVALCQQLALTGREYVETHYTWQAALEPLHQLLDASMKPMSKQHHQRERILATT